MNAQATTSRNAVSSIYLDQLRDIAYRIRDGKDCRGDWIPLLQVIGEFEFQLNELDRIRSKSPQRQTTPAQQWQAQAAQDSIEHWMLAQSSDFDAFLSTAEGESWLEQQAENLADSYFT